MIRVALFALRFAVAAPVCLCLWWSVLPWYAWCVGHAAGLLLRFPLFVPVESVEIVRDGILNTASQVTFTVAGTAYPFPAGAPVLSNTAPFTALVLATGGIALRRRLRVLGTGAAILAATHVGFLVLAFYFKRAIQESPGVPTAIAQLSVTLPFLLWITLAYWEKASAWCGQGAASDETQETDGGQKEAEPYKS